MPKETLYGELEQLLKEGLLEEEQFNYRDKELLRLLVETMLIQQHYFWLGLECEHPDFILDVKNGTWKFLSADEWEEIRELIIKKIRKEANPQKRLAYFRECVPKLERAEYLIEIIRKVKLEYRSLLSIDICDNMFKNGKYSVSDIKEIMPWMSLSDIYGLSKMMSYDIALSEEEYSIIKKEVRKTCQPKVLREQFAKKNNN